MEKYQLEARLEGTHGQPVVPSAPLLKSSNGSLISKGSLGKDKSWVRKDRITTPKIKKPKSRKPGEEGMPPTPLGCEWRKTEDGWNLWCFKSERDGMTGEKIKKSRYAGYLSHDAWQVMKEYDYETFISIIGQRLRRYRQR